MIRLVLSLVLGLLLAAPSWGQMRAGGIRVGEQPALDLRFTESLDSRISFTRASTATCFNSAGVLTTFASGAVRLPCYVYDGANWINHGFRIERSRVKHALWSRDHTDATWVKTNMTTAQDATGLDDTSNSATTLTASAANATSLQTVTISSAQFTFSVYVKRVTGTGDIDITDNNGSNWTTLTGLSTTVWTRHSVTRTQANPVFGIRIVTDEDAVEVDFSELEPGGFASSPSATTTATVTRAADVGSMELSVFDFNVNEGTIYLEYSRSGSLGATRFLNFDDGTNDNRITQLIDANRARFEVRASSTTTGSTGDQSTFAIDTLIKVSTVYRADDIHLAQDGTLAGNPDTSVTLPSGLTTLQFDGLSDGSGRLFGHIARVTYWNRRLPDERLQDDTAFLEWIDGPMFADNDNAEWQKAVGW